MNQNNKIEKLNTIKTYKEINVNSQLPIELDNLDSIKLKVIEVKEGADLKEITLPTIYVAEAKEALKQAKKVLNDAIKEKQAEAKAIELAIKDLETDLKEAVLSKVEVTETPALDKSGKPKFDKWGEIEMKRSHNLNTDLFSYTPESEAKEIDEEKLVKIAIKTEQKLIKDKETASQKHIDIYHLTKKVVVVDQEKLKEYMLNNGVKGLPRKVVTKPAKISIKGSDILKNIPAILESIQPKEESKIVDWELDIPEGAN